VLGFVLPLIRGLQFKTLIICVSLAILLIVIGIYIKKITNFSLIPNHEGETIGKKIESCMLEWGISSIFTVTVDNASANDTAIEYLKRRSRDKVGAILDNEFMHMRCCAHILNLIVTDGLKEVSDSIVKV
jgi:hypothetical protein